MRGLIPSLLLCTSLAFSQTSANETAAQKTLTVPAGQKLLMQLKSGINTKTAKPGDGVYMETSFPVSIDNTMAIPAGTYVQGVIDNVKRSGRDRKSTRLNSSHSQISYAVFCLKNKNK